MHFSGGLGEFVCLDCSWMEGERFELHLEYTSWEDYQIIIPMLLQQYRANRIKYKDLMEALKCVHLSPKIP